MEYEEDVSSTIVEDANCVLLELEERLEEHFIKIHSESKKNLWAFQWAKQTLPTIVSTQAYFNYPRTSINKFTLSRDACLINQPIQKPLFMQWKKKPKVMKILNCAGFIQNLFVVKQQILAHVMPNFWNDSKNPLGSQLTFHKKYADKDFQTEVKEDNFQDLKQYYGLSFDRVLWDSPATIRILLLDGMTTQWLTRWKKIKLAISHDFKSIRIC